MNFLYNKLVEGTNAPSPGFKASASIEALLIKILLPASTGSSNLSSKVLTLDSNSVSLLFRVAISV